MIGYGTCSGSQEKLAAYVWPWVGTTKPLITMSGQSRMTVAYNDILNAYVGKGMDAVILLHDDIEITDRYAEVKFLAAIADDVALVGVAGGKSPESLYWWNYEKVGHQDTDSGLLDFGDRTGDVAFIEGSIMVFSPWAIENLRFDESFPDFRSGYDEICLTALDAGKRNVVVDVDTHHHTRVGWKSPEIEARFAESERMFQAKWADRLPAVVA